MAELEGELEESLAAAGFGSVDTLLSPAQRRAGGLRRRPRRRPLWQLVAAGLGGAAVLAVGGILAVNLFGPDEVTPTTAAPTTTAPTTTTTTLPPEPWDTVLGVPAKTDRVAGQWSFRADIGADGATGLPGVSSRPVLPSADGFYWQGEANDQIRSSPAIFGETVMFGSDDGRLYGFVVTSGPPALWTVRDGGCGGWSADRRRGDCSGGGSRFDRYRDAGVLRVFGWAVPIPGRVPGECHPVDVPGVDRPTPGGYFGGGSGHGRSGVLRDRRRSGVCARCW